MSDDADMAVFRFHDGQHERVIDPMRVILKLQHGKFAELAKKSKGGDAIAQMEMIDAARDIFGLKPVGIGPDGETVGATDLRVLKIVADFAGWQDSLKNALGSIATGVLSMGPDSQTSLPTFSLASG